VPETTFPVQWTGRQAQVMLPEHIDVSNAGQIREQLLAVINQGAEALVADMTATVSCDHAGADAVARAYQRAVVSRTELRLVVTSEVVLRMLGMTGVGRLVPAYPSVEAALAARSPTSIISTVTKTRGRRLAGVSQDRSVTAAEQAGSGADVGVEVALLDRDGVIAWVNQAWRAFAAANGGRRRRLVPADLCRRRRRPGGGRSRGRHPRRAGGRSAGPPDDRRTLSQPGHRTLVRRADLLSLC
jgi:anti-anti-sigma factor